MLKKTLLSSLPLLLIAIPIAEIASARTFRVNCDSVRGNTTRCPVDMRRGQVRLIRSRSNTPCEGNWEFRNQTIIVRDGCRGEFEVRSEGGGGHWEDDDRGDRYREFRNVPRIGRLVVDRRSYYDSRRIREFDAMVNGTRERWWANCRSGDELGTGSRRIPSSRETDRIVDFVCNDRF
jgi:Protein of unknown function (DUF3011)